VKRIGVAAVVASLGLAGFGSMAPAKADEGYQGLAECLQGHVVQMQNPPEGPLPDGFDLNPTVNYAVWAAYRQASYALCSAYSVINCFSNEYVNAQNPPEGPLPKNGFDFNPTANWAGYQVDTAGDYAMCQVLYGQYP
jgi:hypothetical protein